MNPPPFLFCGTEYQFVAEASPLERPYLRWEAHYGMIDDQGRYRAPSFPCLDVVTVRGKRHEESVIFEVREAPDLTPDAVELTPDTLSAGLVFQPLDMPEIVAARVLNFQFFFQGQGLLIRCNGNEVFRGQSEKGEWFTVPLFLTEGINRVTVVAEGREIFSCLVFCDTKPPVVKIGRAWEVENGIALEGWVEDEGDAYIALRRFLKTVWHVVVPWEGEVIREWSDKAGNVTREIFAAARDFRFEVNAPSLVQRGQTVRLEIFCRYRNVPVKGIQVRYGERGETVLLETGQGLVQHVFREIGEQTLSFQVASQVFPFSFLVEAKPVDEVRASFPCEVAQGESFLVHGAFLDRDGMGCGWEKGTLEVKRDGGGTQTYSFVTDEGGNFSIPISLDSPGRYEFHLSGGEEHLIREISVLARRPHSWQVVSPTPPPSLVAGGEYTFRMKLVSSDGQGVEGAKVEWQWERDDGGEVDARAGDVPARSVTNGMVTARFALPTRIGDYALRPVLPCWNVAASPFRIRIEPANLERLVDLTVFPPSIWTNENVFFTVKLEDIYGNPVGNKDLQVYTGKVDPLVKQMTVKTDADGQARFGLSFPEGGTWRVRVSILFLQLSWTIEVRDG